MPWLKPALLGCVAAAFVSATAAQAQQPVKIRASWVAPVANWASILAEKQDLARHSGKSYVFESVRFAGTPPMVTALANNELEIASLAYSSLAIAIQNAGMDDLRVIADEFRDGVEGYYSQEYMVLADGPIKKVEDLKGKVIATNAAGSAVDVATRAMLRKISRPLFIQRDAIGVTQMIVWAARKPFIDKNRAAMIDFMEDTLRTVRWYLDPKNHNEVMQIAARVTKQPPERFDWVFTKKDAYRDPNMLPDLTALQRNVDMTRDLNFVRGTIDIKKHADLSLVEEAARRLR